jgi:hypothetical protein
MNTFCENCGTRCFKKYDFCTSCGVRTSEPEATPERAPYRPAGFPRLKLAVFVAVVLILAAIPTLYGELSLATAAPSMVAMADDAGLSHKGKVTLMSAHPSVTTTIQTDCTTGNSQNTGFAEQGCFVPLSHKIFVLQMPPELADVQVVTVGHEMLHVAYARLSDEEKTRVNRLLEAEVAARDFPGLKEVMANYARTEPGQRTNELHSILGTEYAGLSPDLEQYYSQYFDLRSSVLAANERVLTRFSNLQTSLQALQTQMDTFQKTADSYHASHVRAANSGDAYNANRYYSLHLQAVEQHNAKSTEYNTILKQYNYLARQYNGQEFSSLAQ